MRTRATHPTRRRSTLRAVPTAAHDRATRAVEAPEATEAPDPRPLPAKVLRAIDAIRVPFSAFVDDFTTLTSDRETLAPKFMRAFDLWKAETGGGLADFVRLFDPTVPPSAADYKRHPAYNAADYLRRLVAQGSREDETPMQRAKRLAAAPVSPRRVLAQVLAAFLKVIDPATLDTIYASVKERNHWTDGQVEGLKELVEEESPLVSVRGPRGFTSHSLRLVEAPDASDDAAATA